MLTGTEQIRIRLTLILVRSETDGWEGIGTMADDKMVWIHVEQISDTEWEIRTGDDHEDRKKVCTVTVTGPSSATSDYQGKSGFRPGSVIGQIIDIIRGNPQPQIRSIPIIK